MEAKKKTASPTAGLWKKINSIQTESAKVFKDGKATFGKSEKAVATIESVLDTYLPLCSKHGVSIVPVAISVINSEYRKDKYGEDHLHILVMCKYKAVDVDSGDSHEFDVISHGEDKQDKATGKLLTYALKYAYYQLFSARRGDDDPDVVKEERQEERQKKSSQKPRQEEQSSPEEQPEKKKDDDAVIAKRKELFDEAVAELKAKYPVKDAADSKKLPVTADYKDYVKLTIKHTPDEQVKKHFDDFSVFWWMCLEVAGEKDLAKVKKHFSLSKARISKENVEFLEKQIKRREDAAK